MADLVRQELFALADKIVVKVGTRVLTCADGTLNQQRIAALAEDISALCASGRKVVLVSSGAVGAGMGQLGLTKRPTDVAQLQAIAAVGQSHLIEAYDRCLKLHGRHAAQLLLTADGLNERVRYLNVRNTILTLLEYGAVPIINENDTVSVDELQLTFGDNDRLAAMVANLIRAPLLVLLSDVDGLFNGDPSDPANHVIRTIEKFDDSIHALVRDKITGLSKGGMASKLAAARITTSAGECAIIANGHRDGILKKMYSGEPGGTLFLTQGQTDSARKRWIAYAKRPRGTLKLDAGAQKALAEAGRSLLAIGVAEVAGVFEKGDLVALVGPAGVEFARGLSNYSSVDVDRIKGLHTDRIASVLGHCPYTEIIHRDNLSILV
jgi:glutamate 5-kinase